MRDTDETTRVTGGGQAVRGALPDLGFTLGGPTGARPAIVPPRAIGDVAETPNGSGPPGADHGPGATEGPMPAGARPSLDEQARELVERIAQALAESGPPGWRELSAVFALTSVVGGGQVRYADDGDQVMQAAVADDILTLADAQRRASAGAGDGPWWRMFVWLDADGRLEVDYDYGDEPFPDEQLFAPEAYLADLEEFPRQRLPVWLDAYLHHADRQIRPPAVAAEQARADLAAGVAATQSHNDFPDLPTMWVRWTVMAAAFVAVRSQWGPRIMPSMGWFEGARRSGATLYLLPRGRAVLSGGVWNAPSLAAAYGGSAQLPLLYAGAPDWVTDQVLNARAGSGLLSFCYWWSGDRWYRGESPAGEDLAEALPGVWSDDTVEQVVRGLVEAGPGDLRASHVSDLLAAAYEGEVTRSHLLSVFGADADLDTAMNQMTLSGAAIVSPPSIREHDR